MAEHENSAEHTVAEHAHQDGCGHETVQHDDHVDFAPPVHHPPPHGAHYADH